jgi:hypothetical protein
MECEYSVSHQVLKEQKTMEDKGLFWLLRFVGFLMWILLLFAIVVVITTLIVGVISYIVDPSFGQPII